jgi:hypothetical protein
VEHCTSGALWQALNVLGWAIAANRAKKLERMCLSNTRRSRLMQARDEIIETA